VNFPSVTTDSTVSCDAGAWRTVREHVASTWPREACGLLIGHAEPGGWRVVRAAPAANRAENPERAFDLDPGARAAWQRRLREAGGSDAVIGHYHSHPDGPSRPSSVDRARAEETGLIWLIVAAESSGTASVAAFFAEEEHALRGVTFVPDAET